MIKVMKEQEGDEGWRNAEGDEDGNDITEDGDEEGDKTKVRRLVRGQSREMRKRFVGRRDDARIRDMRKGRCEQEDFGTKKPQ